MPIKKQRLIPNYQKKFTKNTSTEWVYPTQFSQEEPLPIKEPPTIITRQTLQQTQLEASHEMITEGLVATYG